MMPTTGVSPSSSATSVPKIGRPVMKARVPSIGSSTQRNRASGLLQAELLAENAAFGTQPPEFRPHRLFGVTVGDGHGRLIGLQIGRDGTAEKRPDHSAGRIGRANGRRNVTIEIGAQGFGNGSGLCDRLRR